MPTIMTRRQAQVLDEVRRSVETRGYPPSLRELAARLKLSGTRAVEKHLAALERKGQLKRGSGARSLDLAGRAAGRAVPIVGVVTAGQPILAEENLDGRLTLDPSLARWKDCFLLRVKGDSMRGAGILDKDLVLVKPQASAEPGEIVVARLGNEATVKRFRRRGGRVTLEPENPAYEPIHIDETRDFAVLGTVAGVLRTSL